jgi:hypothetical protein
MPRTVDHIVAAHQLAAERRTSGRPVWDETVDVSDVWRDDALSFERRRDAIVAKLKASHWYQRDGADEGDELNEVVWSLAEADDADCFDHHWDELYDLADYACIWIKTF